MKTIYNSQSNMNVISMDDIIFAGRNQAYGAFYLRRNYNKFLIRSFLFISALVAAIFAVSIMNRTKVIPIIEIGSIPIEPIPFNQQTTIVPPTPPGPVAPSRSIRDLLTSRPPIVGDFPDDAHQLPINEDFPNVSNPFSELGNAGGLSAIPGGGDGEGIIPDDTTIYRLPPQEPASFQNGDFRKWVAEHVKYPEEIARMEIEGKVFFQFVINKQGYAEDVNIMRGIDPALDQEVVKVIMHSPRWTPGKQGGTPVKQRFIMQIYFKLDR